MAGLEISQFWGDPKVEAFKSWVAEIAANDAEELSL